jgi:hypothetical protein
MKMSTTTAIAMKLSHLLSMIVFGFICLGSVGCQTASKECQQTANPFPTLDPIETWRNYSRPNIEVDQVCAFTGQVTRGQTYKHQVTQNLVFCLIPNHFFSGEVTGWEMKISNTMDGDCGDNFAPIVNPPFRGNLLFDIHGWQFRNKDNTGENDGSVNAPQKERQFGFLLNENDYNLTMGRARCSEWGIDCLTATPPGKDVRTSEIPRSVAIFTITDMELGNLTPNETAWIERMNFEVKIYLPSN